MELPSSIAELVKDDIAFAKTSNEVPIYFCFDDLRHQNFTKLDHFDAALAHTSMANFFTKRAVELSKDCIDHQEMLRCVRFHLFQGRKHEKKAGKTGIVL